MAYNSVLYYPLEFNLPAFCKSKLLHSYTYISIYNNINSITEKLHISFISQTQC